MNTLLTVNGEAIDPALVEEAFFRIKAAAEAASGVSCCDRDREFLAAAEEEVIDGILLAQEAEHRVPPPSESDVRAALEATLREWRQHGASWEMLESRRTMLRDETVARLRMERFTARLAENLPDLTEEELRCWHAARRDEFRVPAETRALHLVMFPAPDDPWPKWHTMLLLREQLLAGADFATLAREHTEKPGGDIDLGWLTHERSLHPFESVLFSMRNGETSPVIAHEQALHLVQATEVKPGRLPAFEEIADAVRARATADRYRAALHACAAELRRSAVICRAAPPA